MADSASTGFSATRAADAAHSIGSAKRLAEKVEAAGLTWRNVGGFPYWDESAFYEFTAPAADLLAGATNELERMTREAVQHAIDNRLYAKMAIPELAIPLIERSWEAESPSLYGRFDLIYDGCHPPKL